MFYDEFAIQFYDSEDPELEQDHFLMPGLSNESRIRLVCHCERDSGNTIRLISARRATSKERHYYEGETSWKKNVIFQNWNPAKIPMHQNLKKPITMRLSQDVIEYFKEMAKDSGYRIRVWSIDIYVTASRIIVKSIFPGIYNRNRFRHRFAIYSGTKKPHRSIERCGFQVKDLFQ